MPQPAPLPSATAAGETCSRATTRRCERSSRASPAARSRPWATAFWRPSRARPHARCAARWRSPRPPGWAARVGRRSAARGRPVRADRRRGPALMQIRAAVLEEFGRALEVQELDLAEPRAGEVLVRLVACGVCHTDMYTASGADPSGYSPTVLGHEGAGVVERVGDDVTSLAPGDHVVTLFSPQCRGCIHCLRTRTNLCLAIRVDQDAGSRADA